MKSERGQAAVETAIVMPLYVFLVLGMLQLGLLHQARQVTKYAAYKAARTGSIHNAKKSSMIKAALSIVLPYSGRHTSDSFFNASVTQFGMSWAVAKKLNEAAGERIVDVTICEPTGAVSGDFDDPAGDMGETDQWQQLNKGRLAVQVTFYSQLVIPFANMVLWSIVAGQENSVTMRNLRMNTPTSFASNRPTSRTVMTNSDIKTLAARHIYVLPIRANWSMRMQSNFLSKYPIPGKNECKFPWN